MIAQLMATDFIIMIINTLLCLMTFVIVRLCIACLTLFTKINAHIKVSAKLKMS